MISNSIHLQQLTFISFSVSNYWPYPVGPWSEKNGTHESNNSFNRSKSALIGAASHHMTRQCQAGLPWCRHVATPARSAYLPSAATWRQKHQSYTPRRNLKYRTFLFVGIAEIGTVSVLSSNHNQAYIGCWLKPETLTWPILHKLT